ncbi:FecR family protein [Sunxiuqinia sp. A32]|uniref:FecR family protein n=1 Tax=Sunxiuqinia sp. A32 TaxID=3461496 RepID=UPI004045BB01
MNDHLLARYIAGDVSEEEKILIAEWLDESPNNLKELMALRKAYDISLCHSDSVHHDLKSSATRKKTFSVRRISIEVLKVAAVLLVAFGVYRFFTPENGGEDSMAMHTIEVPVGQHAELTLADGTKVWLNTKTKLTFPEAFDSDKRVVILDGEGYFDVAKNAERPFFVKTKKYSVKVLGTEFNVRAYDDNGYFETSLMEGSVEVLKTNEDRGVKIRPSERIYLSDDKLNIGPILDYKQFNWKEGLICFDDESFNEIMKKLELYFDVQISVNNSVSHNYSCTGKFRTTDGVEHILKVLQLRNDFNYKYVESEKKIIIE